MNFKEYRQRIAESTNPPKITVDGQEKHLTQSTGERIHPTDDGVKNFHKWFGDSDSVDEHGRPLVVYHATPALEREQSSSTPLPFNKFEKTESGVYSFSTNKTFANRYAQTKQQDARMDKTPFQFAQFIKTKTFDPKNSEHQELLRKHLPEIVPHESKYGWGSFGGEQKIHKDDFISKLAGTETSQSALTKEDHAKMEVGKSHFFNGGNVFVHHKDEHNAWVSPLYQLDNIDNKTIHDISAKTQQNPSDGSETHNVKQIQRVAWELPKKSKITVQKITTLPKTTHDNDNWEYTENDTLRHTLQTLGFNAIKQTESKHENIAVFSPHQIKSATHNNGMFSHSTQEIDK